MARIVFGMNLSLDGYVDFQRLPEPDAALFQHWTEHVSEVAGSLYGRQMYETMRYWDDEHAEWTPAERDFALAWRKQPKWVVSRSQPALGPNATLVAADVEAAVRRLKSEVDGEIAASGPELAQSLTEMGLIDEYRLYLHPVVLGGGKPFFAGARPPLRLVASERIGGEVIRLTYVPA